MLISGKRRLMTGKRRWKKKVITKNLGFVARKKRGMPSIKKKEEPI